MSPAGTSVSGPMWRYSSPIKAWQKRRISASERPLGLKSDPPLPPPKGSVVTAFFRTCSVARNFRMLRLTVGCRRRLCDIQKKKEKTIAYRDDNAWRKTCEGDTHVGTCKLEEPNQASPQSLSTFVPLIWPSAQTLSPSAELRQQLHHNVPALVRPNCRVHLHAEAAVDVQLAVIVIPGDAELDDTLRLKNGLGNWSIQTRDIARKRTAAAAT